MTGNVWFSVFGGKDMNIIKNSLIIASYVLLIAVFFMCGYAFGNYKIEPADVAVATYEPVSEAAVNAVKMDEKEEVTVYMVLMENDVLNLYSVNGGEKILLGSEKISANIFPREDIEMLKNGITTDNLAEAQELFENFVS